MIYYEQMQTQETFHQDRAESWHVVEAAINVIVREVQDTAKQTAKRIAATVRISDLQQYLPLHNINLHSINDICVTDRPAELLAGTPEKVYTVTSAEALRDRGENILYPAAEHRPRKKISGLTKVWD